MSATVYLELLGGTVFAAGAALVLLLSFRETLHDLGRIFPRRLLRFRLRTLLIAAGTLQLALALGFTLGAGDSYQACQIALLILLLSLLGGGVLCLICYFMDDLAGGSRQAVRKYEEIAFGSRGATPEPPSSPAKGQADRKSVI